MELARRARLKLTYNKTDISEDLAPHLVNFSCTDHASGKADDLQITLEDKAGLWRADWVPEKGATVEAVIQAQNWEKTGLEELPLGTFEIDEIESSGPPETVKVKAVSVPVSSSLRGEDKNKAWEKTRLSVIAGDIAAGAGLELFYDTDDDPEYDRVEQTEQSDLAFLVKLCEDAGLSLKVTSQIVIFDDTKYEQLEPVITITRGVSPVISYSATSSTRDVYSAARVEYKGGSQKEEIRYTYSPPNRPATGKTLVINERVTSIAEAERLARKRLRQKNKEEVRFSLTMMGNIALVAGVTVMIQGWGVFDGKYFIEEATHKGPGYTTSLDLRRVLEGY
jgi:hypothetical protein